MTAPRRKHSMVTVVLLAMLVAGAGGLVLAAGTAQTPNASSPSGVPLALGDTTTLVPPLTRSPPDVLTIPAMGLETRLVSLEANKEDMMELPPVQRAGWYTGSVTPGERGLTVIAGYIRRATNEPGIFKNLRRLRVGAQMVLARADGTSVSFQVTRIESYDQGAFPADEVYASGVDAEVRLVTTGGALKGSDPLGNVVVFARFTGASTTGASTTGASTNEENPTNTTPPETRK